MLLSFVLSILMLAAEPRCSKLLSMFYCIADPLLHGRPRGVGLLCRETSRLLTWQSLFFLFTTRRLLMMPVRSLKVGSSL